MIQRKMLKLVDAQIAVDAFEEVAKSIAATVVPMDVRGDDLTAWRAMQLDPSKNPQWQQAIKERDSHLSRMGFSLEDWLQCWDEARGR